MGPPGAAPGPSLRRTEGSETVGGWETACCLPRFHGRAGQKMQREKVKTMENKQISELFATLDSLAQTAADVMDAVTIARSEIEQMFVEREVSA